VPRVPGLWREKIFEPRQFRHLYLNSTAGRPGVRIERALLLNSRHGRTCGWLDPVAIDHERTLDPTAILTARASFRSCSKFPICLHRQARVLACFAPYPTGNKGPPMHGGSFTLADASCGLRAKYAYKENNVS